MADRDPASDAAAPASYRLPIGDEAKPALASTLPRVGWDRVLLQENAIWFCRLRWIVVGVFFAAAAAACFPELTQAMGIALHVGWPLAIAVILTSLNVVWLALLRSPRLAAGPAGLHLWMQIFADLVVLTAVIHFLGSVETPAPFMYLFHIILACVFSPPRQSLAVMSAAAVLYLGCLELEETIVAPATVVMDIAISNRNLSSGHFWSVHVAPLLGIWGIIWYLASRLAGALRQREADLAITNARLKASSEERARHMLDTTHQLKAPFAAIHANAQLLINGSCGPLPEAARVVVQKIAARCAVLSQQLLDMLQLANLRSESQASIPAAELSLADALCASIARVEPAATLRGITIATRLEPVSIRAVEDHIRMLVDNVLTNAVNYSYDGGQVMVTCRRESDRIACVVVRDHGIGIAADKLPHIFEDYYRTREAVRHNKASTGLGLSIVRHVARVSGIDVQVESAPHWGTQFSLAIPTNWPVGGSIHGIPADR